MIARRIVLALALLLWAVIAFLTVYVLIANGPDVLVLVSLVMVAVLGFGFFGAFTERR